MPKNTIAKVVYVYHTLSKWRGGNFRKKKGTLERWEIPPLTSCMKPCTSRVKAAKELLQLFKQRVIITLR